VSIMLKVSVIIPTYNRQDVITKTVHSVLNQTERNLEVIVVDDGSTDNTRAVIEKLADSRVNYFYKTNAGPASARNFGLSKASGGYVAFLDSDDLWPENYLEVMLANLENNRDFGAAYAPITVVFPDGRSICSYKKPEGKSGVLSLDLFEHSFIWIFAVVFRGEIWTDFYFDEQLKRTCEDSDVLLRLSMRTQFLFVDDTQAYHTISGDSIAVQAGVSCERMLILERFYYELGGNKAIPYSVAMRKLSHSCRKVAENRRKLKAKSAAIKLYGRAIRYWPLDIRLYFGLLRAMFITKDTEPGWQMPQPLGEPLGTNRFLRE
jgi:glycosyltransferase involved in cell wall biosynthesis